MNLVFQEFDLLASVIDNNGTPQYETTSSAATTKGGTYHTVIRALSSHPMGEHVVGEVDWKRQGFPHIEIFGRSVDFNEYLHRKTGLRSTPLVLLQTFGLMLTSSSISCRSRTFVASDGRKYKWKQKGRDEKLKVMINFVFNE